MGAGKKIGILINCLEVGGAQKMALQIFDLMERQFDTSILMVVDRTQAMALHPDPSRAAVLEKRTFHLSSVDAESSTLRKILLAPLQYIRLLALIRTYDLNVVISFEDRANMFNMITLGRGRRIISVRHPMRAVLAVKAPLKAALIHLFFSLFRHRVDIANFNSAGSLREFCTLFPLPERKTCVIHNFCDHNRLYEAAALPPKDPALSALGGREFIVACGRFKPVKGFLNLIRIFSKVVEEHPEYCLVLMGDGPMESEYRSLVCDMGLENQVVFTGFQMNTAPWIAGARLFVLTSQSEGFPNVILEALALKTAVISVDCQWGPKEILDPMDHSVTPIKKVRFAPFGVITPPMTNIRPLRGAPLDTAERLMARAIMDLLGTPEKISEYEAKGYLRSLDFSGKAQERDWISLAEYEPRAKG